jgi:hypothetical protein
VDTLFRSRTTTNWAAAKRETPRAERAIKHGNRAPAVLSQAGAPLFWTSERADTLRLRASEEGSGLRAPALASGASNGQRREQRRRSSASDDEFGGSKVRQDRAPLSWTNERADTLFVRE